MKIIVTKNHAESCRLVADMIVDVVQEKPDAVLGLATGGTAEQVYEELVSSYENKKVSFEKVKTVNLDEYVGLTPEHDQSYRYFMNKFLFDRVNIDKKNTYVPVGNLDPQTVLKEFQHKLADTPRDLQLLGVGPNGHIAFNEPDSYLHGMAHIVKIAEATIKANARYFASEADVPKTAFTQGMGDILKAKKLVLLATGANKAEAMSILLMGDQVTTQCPCTFLKLHHDATVFLDQALADMIGYKR
ncbi:MAG: glucosamine-6-phosphate deaminase [Brevinema sp.]